MHGARKLAKDYIQQFSNPEAHVLDVCCGDCWPGTSIRYSTYRGVDIKDGRDITKSDELDPQYNHLPPDLILSIYGLCALCNEEARVWTLLRRIAKPTTKFVYVGRYASPPRRESNRQDPINGYDLEALEGLALASGWIVMDFKRFIYDGDGYIPAGEGNANAFAATLEPIE